MSSYGNFNSTEEMSRFNFTMRATSNDIKTVNSYGDMAFISTDQELPYDNEKKRIIVSRDIFGRNFGVDDAHNH